MFPSRYPLRPLLALTLVGASAAVSLTKLPEAKAVAAPFAYIYLNSDEFPSGGVITGSVGCSGYNCSAGGPFFSDETGDQVTGSFLEGGTGAGTFVFLPDAPLPEGTYQATTSGTFGGTSSFFDIIAATDELPTVVPSVNIRTSAAGELIECIESQVTSPLSFSSKTLASPVVFTTISGPTSTQYRYTTVPAGEPPTAGTTYDNGLVYETWDDDVCYEVYGFPFTSDETVLIDAGCLSVTDLELGELDVPYGNIDGTLAGCTIPPEGFDDEWCVFFESALASQSCDSFPLESCFAARRACAGGDNPSFEEEDAAIAERDADGGFDIDDSTTTGGEPTSGGTGDTESTTGVDDEMDEGGTSTGNTSTTGEGTTEDSSSDTDPSSESTSHRAGCSLTPSPATPHRWSLLGLGWLLVWTHRLRRTKRTITG